MTHSRLTDHSRPAIAGVSQVAHALPSPPPEGDQVTDGLGARDRSGDWWSGGEGQVRWLMVWGRERGHRLGGSWHVTSPENRITHRTLPSLVPRTSLVKNGEKYNLGCGLSMMCWEYSDFFLKVWPEVNLSDGGSNYFPHGEKAVRLPYASATTAFWLAITFSLSTGRKCDNMLQQYVLT